VRDREQKERLVCSAAAAQQVQREREREREREIISRLILNRAARSLHFHI
jgi:hypothetical protein